MEELCRIIMEHLFPDDMFSAFEYVGQCCICKIANKDLFFKMSLYTPDDSFYIEGIELCVFNSNHIIDMIQVRFDHLYKNEVYFKIKNGEISSFPVPLQNMKFEPIRSAVKSYLTVFVKN